MCLLVKILPLTSIDRYVERLSETIVSGDNIKINAPPPGAARSTGDPDAARPTERLTAPNFFAIAQKPAVRTTYPHHLTYGEFNFHSKVFFRIRSSYNNCPDNGGFPK